MSTTDIPQELSDFKPLALNQTVEALQHMARGELDSHNETERVARSAMIHLRQLRRDQVAPRIGAPGERLITILATAAGELGWYDARDLLPTSTQGLARITRQLRDARVIELEGWNGTTHEIVKLTATGWKLAHTLQIIPTAWRTP